MGLLSFLKRTKSIGSGPLAFLIGLGGPAAKSHEYLQSYTGRVYACASAIADEVATIELRLQQKSGMAGRRCSPTPP